MLTSRRLNRSALTQYDPCNEMSKTLHYSYTQFVIGSYNVFLWCAYVVCCRWVLFFFTLSVLFSFRIVNNYCFAMLLPLVQCWWQPNVVCVCVYLLDDDDDDIFRGHVCFQCEYACLNTTAIDVSFFPSHFSSIFCAFTHMHGTKRDEINRGKKRRQVLFLWMWEI